MPVLLTSPSRSGPAHACQFCQLWCALARLPAMAHAFLNVSVCLHPLCLHRPNSRNPDSSPKWVTAGFKRLLALESRSAFLVEKASLPFSLFPGMDGGLTHRSSSPVGTDVSPPFSWLSTTWLSTGLVHWGAVEVTVLTRDCRMGLKMIPGVTLQPT